MAIHVDDTLFTGPEEAITATKAQMCQRFKMKDLGEVEYALGMQFERSEDLGTTKIHQGQYIRTKLEELGLADCRPVSTPGDGLIQSHEEGDVQMEDPEEYRKSIGSLMYASYCTRPDITAVVNRLAQFFNNLAERYMVAAKRVWRYLKGTADLGIVFRSGDQNDQEKGIHLLGYSDADYAADKKDRRSVGAHVFKLANGPIFWQSRRQRTIATSTLEAEYMALASATREAFWIRSLLKELDMVDLIGSSSTVTIMGDNQGSIATAKNPEPRAKHIDIQHHYVREKVADGVISISYCPTTDMVADILTKPLPRVAHEKLRKDMGMA